MNRLLAFWVTLLVVLSPSHARAGTPYSVHWEMLEESNSCEDARLTVNGGDYFYANGAPLPTFEVPGAYVSIPNGPKRNVAEAPFDSVLLRMGANEFTFGVRNSKGDDSCVHQQNLVTLVSVSLGLNKPLFNVRRDGTAYRGSTQIGLTLSEINPPLARDIVNLEAEIAAERKWLLENASKAADLAARLDLLQQLDTELHDLVSRPLDEIREVDLDAILDRYEGVVDEATQAALEQLLADLKKSVQDLKDELSSLLDHFGAQADAVADLVTQGAEAAGFSPDDPFGYSLGPGDVPWVEIPDVSGVSGAFDPGKDPYAAYADAVIESLSQDVQGGKVVLRGDFVTNVRAWRANTAAIEKALLARVSVSQAETSAFLKGQIRVTDYVRKYMDASDWFLDSPIPPDVRAQVDGVLKNAFAEMAEDMKERLSEWEALSLSAQESHLMETIRAFSGAMSAIGDDFAPYVETMQLLVHASTRIAIGFVPFVGPTLDLCEAVTGREYCLPGGKELSTEERIFSGVGFGFGKITKVWAGIKAAGVKPGAKIVAAGMLGYTDEFLKALQANRRKTYKTLNAAMDGALGEIKNGFETKAGLYLMQQEGRMMLGVGDDGVRKVLGLPKATTSRVQDAAKAPDFLTTTKGNKLALSEVKGLESETGGIDAGDAVKQLKNALDKLKELGLGGDVSRVEIIVPKGAQPKGDWAFVKGYLVKPREANKRHTIHGKEVLVIHL